MQIYFNVDETNTMMQLYNETLDPTYLNNIQLNIQVVLYTMLGMLFDC